MRGISGLTGTMPSGMIRGGSAGWQIAPLPAAGRQTGGARDLDGGSVRSRCASKNRTLISG